MPDKCVVFGCSNVPNKEEGIALHPIPFYGSDDPQKRRRQKKWVDFVQLKHAHWKPSKYSNVCSKHFREEDFAVRFSELTDDRFMRFMYSPRSTLLVYQAKANQLKASELRER